jgi:pimeloyl-ACP methyl ester carboxylesterase
VPLLLVMGLGCQLVFWDEPFLDLLVARGFYVIRFDNRDVGQSTVLDHLPSPTMAQLGSGEPVLPAYSLADMAADSLGLLDGLGIESAHVLGVSMGGMIAQLIAVRAPQRVRSLVSIMSTTNDRDLPGPTPEGIQALLSLLSGQLDSADPIGAAIAAYRRLAGSGFPFNEARILRRLMAAVQRGFSPTGVARQFLAVLTAEGRREALRELNVPTLVIHGADDPLVPLAAGRATAEAIPNAKLWVIPGMGHDLPEPMFAPVADAVAELADLPTPLRPRAAAA